MALLASSRIAGYAGATVTPLATERAALVNVAPVALAAVLAYALVVGVGARDLSAAAQARSAAIVLAGVALGVTMWRRPAGLVRALDIGLTRLSWLRVILAALALRVSWVLLGDVTQTSDFAVYDRMALDILAGRHFVDPVYPTGPSIVFALHYLVLGHEPRAPQLTLALLSTAQVLLVYGLLLRTTANRRAALLAATVLAIWPEHVLYVNLLGSDVLFATLVLVATWLLTGQPARGLGPSRAAVVAAGMVLGISHWVRNTVLVFLLPAGLYLALRGPEPPRRRALAVGTLAAGFLVPLLPLVYLNYLTLGVPSPTASQIAGWSLLVGANADSRGMFSREDMALVDRMVAAQDRPPGERRFITAERISRALAWERIREQPGRYVWTMARHKVSLLWARAAEVSWSVRTSRLGAAEDWMREAADAFHGLAVAAAIVGLSWVAARGRYAWDARQVLFWAALPTTLIHCVLEVQPRYHHMFLPTLAIAIGQLMLAGDPGEPGGGDDPPPRQTS